MPVHYPWQEGHGTPLRVHHSRNQPMRWGDPLGGKAFQPRNFRSNTCWDWNQGACKYNPYKYRHICSECGGRHPQTQCSQNEEVATGAKRQLVTKGGRGGQRSDFGPVGLTLQTLEYVVLMNLSVKSTESNLLLTPRRGMCTHRHMMRLGSRGCCLSTHRIECNNATSIAGITPKTPGR